MSKVEVSLVRRVSGGSAVAKLGAYAPAVMLGACAVGLVSLFLPAVTLSFLGMSESIAVFRDWRGKLALVGYAGVAVMAGRMMMTSEAPKPQVAACLVVAAVVALLAIWLPLSIGGGKGARSSAIRVGIGCYVNILGAVVLTGAAAVLAKRENGA